MAVRTEVGPDQASAPEAEVPLRETVRHCLGVFLGVRLGLGLLAFLATALLPANTSLDVPGWSSPEPSSWSAAFFPLYPLLVRGVSFALGGHPLAAALLVTNACALAAMVVCRG